MRHSTAPVVTNTCIVLPTRTMVEVPVFLVTVVVVGSGGRFCVLHLHVHHITRDAFETIDNVGIVPRDMAVDGNDATHASGADERCARRLLLDGVLEFTEPRAHFTERSSGIDGSHGQEKAI